MPHPTAGFGLCHARNQGLGIASGPLIAYLDDDNAIAPEFVAQVRQFYQQQAQLQCSMVQQWRRRDRIKGGGILTSSRPFLSPSAIASVEDLLAQRQLFDSNGFVHRRSGAPQWNPHYRIFADYEYFLQCLSLWGEQRFHLIPEVLIQYVQRSDGIIGQSSYAEWAEELAQILANAAHYSVLTPQVQTALQSLLRRWQGAADAGYPIPAFSS